GAKAQDLTPLTWGLKPPPPKEKPKEGKRKAPPFAKGAKGRAPKERAKSRTAPFAESAKNAAPALAGSPNFEEELSSGAEARDCTAAMWERKPPSPKEKTE